MKFQNSANDIISTKEDFSDLPPNQRRKKLQQKIDDINSKVSLVKARIRAKNKSIFFSLSPGIAGDGGQGRTHEDEASLRVQSGVGRSPIHSRAINGKRPKAGQAEGGAAKIPGTYKNDLFLLFYFNLLFFTIRAMSTKWKAASTLPRQTH